MSAVTEDVGTWTIKALDAYTGGLSKPSKMPGYAYSLPARECITGGRLRTVEGSTCSGCYALKGRYVFPVVQAALYRRLHSLGSPLWAEAMAERILRTGDDCFRWHDSGDLQSTAHLEAIVRVCEMTPAVRHWLPTREYRIVRDFVGSGGAFPPNLNVRLSAHMIGGHAPTNVTRGLPITASTVSTGEMPGAHECPSRFQDNQCGDCRACWDRGVPVVNYHLH